MVVSGILTTRWSATGAARTVEVAEPVMEFLSVAVTFSDPVVLKVTWKT